MGTLLVLLIGILIGWNIPQPAYAKRLQDLVVGKIKELFGKSE